MEEWRTLANWPKYQVSDLGNVRKADGTPMHPNVIPTGYRYVTLTPTPNKRHYVKVAKLVATTFHGPRPHGYLIDHINRCKTDDRATNLRYITRSANAANSDKVEFSSHVVKATATPRLLAQWRVYFNINRRNKMFGSYYSREYAEWVANFVKRHDWMLAV